LTLWIFLAILPRLMVLRRAAVQPAESRNETHARARRSFAAYADQIGRRRRSRTGYLAELVRMFKFYVEPDARVLELGVGTGDLLAQLRARRAVGVDISPEMLAIAREHHPELELYHTAAEDLGLVEGPFDYVVLSDLTVSLYDILAVFRELKRLCHPRTRVIISFHSRLWQPALSLLAAMGLHHGHERTNWVTTQDIANLLELGDFEVLKTDTTAFVPWNVPLLAPTTNRFLARLPALRHLSLINWVVARPRGAMAQLEDLSLSVVCPCRNEMGNIAEIINRVPKVGKRTELIFVEGNSTDQTWERIQDELRLRRRPELEISACRQRGKGKGDAVRLGFERATGDVLAILDADLTVPPEDLPTFVAAVASGKGEFVNGSRLVYPMNDGAMRFLNIAGNKFFARLFSYLLGQPLKDTLCGTKVLTRDDYQRLAQGRSYFGEFDPFGDFDLLFGAAKLNLKIVELPIRYRERRYGDTNIRRFRDGWLLLRMSWTAWRRLKLV
jgi:SAM-dependent methyltransferase